MKRSIGILFALLAGAAFLSACNGSSNNNGGGNTGPCGAPGSGFQVLYPKPGAKGIGANVGGVYVANNPAFPSGNLYDFFAVQSNGNTQFTGTFATYTGPIPNPHNTPAPGATVYATAFLYPIGPLQTVNLYWNNGGISCTPNVIVSSFSTE